MRDSDAQQHEVNRQSLEIVSEADVIGCVRAAKRLAVVDDSTCDPDDDEHKNLLHACVGGCPVNLKSDDLVIGEAADGHQEHHAVYVEEGLTCSLRLTKAAVTGQARVRK